MSKQVRAIDLSILRTSPVPGQEWAIAVATRKADDRAIVFRYINSFAPHFNRARQSDRIIIVWPYTSDRGMPSVAQRQRMDALEDALAEAVESDGLATLAIVSTGDGSREWIYYTKSEHEFMRRLNVALRKLAAYPIEIHAAADPGWNSYEQFLSGVVDGRVQ